MNKWYSFLVSTKEVKITKPLRWEKHFLSISILSTILFAVWWNQEWSVLLAKTFSLKYQLSSFVHFISFCVCSKPNSPWRQNDDFSRSSCFFYKRLKLSSLWGCDVDDCDRYFFNQAEKCDAFAALSCKSTVLSFCCCNSEFSFVPTTVQTVHSIGWSFLLL